MRPDMHQKNQITPGSAIDSRRTLAADPDSLAVRDSFRNLDSGFLSREDYARSATRGTDFSVFVSGAAAGWTFGLLLKTELQSRALNGVAEIDGGFRFHVGAALGARLLRAAAEKIGKEIREVRRTS